MHECPEQQLNKLNKMAAFLSQAELIAPRANRRKTMVSVGLAAGRSRTRISVPAERMSLVDSDSMMLKALAQKFGLSSFCSWSMLELKKEAVARGGRPGLEKVRNALDDLDASGVVQKERAAAVLQAELSRALAAVRRAQRAGATSQQLVKIVQTAIAEKLAREANNA